MNTNTPKEAKLINLRMYSKPKVESLEKLFSELYTIQKTIELHLNNSSY